MVTGYIYNIFRQSYGFILQIIAIYVIVIVRLVCDMVQTQHESKVCTRPASQLPSGLAARVVTRTCQLSYHWGTALIWQAEKKQLMGSGENVAESTPQGIDSYYLVDFDICITVLHGAVRP